FDELMLIHEGFGEPMRDLLNIQDGNPFYHAWVVLAMIAALFFVFLFVSIKTAKTINVAQKKIVMYVVFLAIGVISLEIIGTQLYFSQTVYKLGPVLIEEMFEMGMAS